MGSTFVRFKESGYGFWSRDYLIIDFFREFIAQLKKSNSVPTELAAGYDYWQALADDQIGSGVCCPRFADFLPDNAHIQQFVSVAEQVNQQSSERLNLLKKNRSQNLDELKKQNHQVEGELRFLCFGKFIVRLLQGTLSHVHTYTFGSDRGIEMIPLIDSISEWLSHERLGGAVHNILFGETAIAPGLFVLQEGDEIRIEGFNRTCTAVPALVITPLNEKFALEQRRDYWNIYEKYGVREYWLINFACPMIEVYELVQGKLQRQGVYSYYETFYSPALKHDVEINPLFDNVI